MERPDNVTPLSRKIGEVAEDGKTVMGRKGFAGGRRTHTKKGHRVAQVDLDVLMKIEMTDAEHRVFATIARYIPDRGGVEARVSVKEIAEKTGMLQPAVSRVIGNLVKRDIIFRVRQGVWEVNPHILYNGDFVEWNSVLDGYLQPKVKR